MRSAAKKIALNALYMLLAVGIVLGVWAIAAASVGSKLILPSIADTFSALGDVLFAKGTRFWSGMGGTLLRALMSYAISLGVFALLFFLCSVFTPAARVIDPIISLLRTLPTMAVTLLLAIWAGAYFAPVILGVIVIMPVLYSSVTARTATVPKELAEVARMCGANRAQVFANVTMPYAASSLPEALSSALSFNIKIVVAAEILMQTANSLGMLMQLAQTYYETATLIAFVVCAVVVSVATEFVLRAVLKRLLAKYRDNA